MRIYELCEMAIEVESSKVQKLIQASPSPFKLRIDEYSQLLDYRFNWNPDQSENNCILEVIMWNT